ncbi:MAG: CDP-alcohol phosphatidyltransferase family protein [Patescibacteria group bacterium]|jgi:CDP-diacylglycerol--glycerol-3-phosphate 3-phosphatidyltransferase
MPNQPAKLFPHDRFFYPLISWIPRWVEPNHITLLRLILTPFVIIFLLYENYDVGVPLFLLTALTDAVDGTLARVRNQVTPWGIFYDPVADKILIGSVVLLIVIRHVNPILALAIIGVEILLIAGGWYRRRKTHLQSANIWGKIKMILEVVGVLFLLIALWSGVDLFVQISSGTLIVAMIFAIVSLLTYSL